MTTPPPPSAPSDRIPPAARASTADDHAPDSAPAGTRRRLALRTVGWWAHGLLRAWAALMLLVYGGAKLTLMQFGIEDTGSALTTFGEMSPMGLLWRFVGFSPTFQLLSGLAEVGAGLLLLWRRTTAIGALIGVADMVFVFVLNMAYDVPVKVLSALIALGCAVILVPWVPRLFRAFTGAGPIGRGPLPRLIPVRRVERIADVVVPVLVVLLAGVIGAGSWWMASQMTTDTAKPVGVWTVVQDAKKPAAQLAEDRRISAIALGGIAPPTGSPMAQVRYVDGTLETGRWRRDGDRRLVLELRPLRGLHQGVKEWLDMPSREVHLTVADAGGGRLRLTGAGMDIVVAPDEERSVLYDRGFSWSPRPDDPYNR